VGDTNLEIVLFRLCVRMRGLGVKWNFASNVRGGISLFPLCMGAFPFSLVRTQCIRVSSNEFKEF